MFRVLGVYNFAGNLENEPFRKNTPHSLCTELIIYEIWWFWLVTVLGKVYGQHLVLVLVFRFQINSNGFSRDKSFEHQSRYFVYLSLLLET